MKIRVVVLAGTFFISAMTIAHAELSWSNPTPTGQTAGLQAGHTQSRRFASGYAMTGIQMRERQDNPIFIEIFGRRLCASGSASCSYGGVAQTWRLQDGVSGNITSSKDAFVDEGFYVTGLEVCLNRNRDKIKGVRLFGRPIEADGTINSDVNPVRVKFKRANCDDWTNQVDCPVNQVIVGLEVKYGYTTGAHGFKPICAAIDPPSGLRRPDRPSIQAN